MVQAEIQGVSDTRSSAMRRLVKVMGLLALLVPTYIFWWHVSFVLIFLSRGDSIDLGLYGYYLEFVFGPGFEIPTLIQFFAIILTVLTFVIGLCRTIVSNRRSKASRN